MQGPTPLPDGEDEGGRAEGQQPGGGKRHVIGPQPDAQETAAVGRQGGADLMAEEDPAKEDWPGAGPEEVGRQAGRGGHGGNPVEAIDHAKQRQLRQIIGIRQIEQRQPPQPIVGRQQEAFVIAITEPARAERADNIEHPHQRQGRGRGDR